MPKKIMEKIHSNFIFSFILFKNSYTRMAGIEVGKYRLVNIVTSVLFKLLQ